MLYYINQSEINRIIDDLSISAIEKTKIFAELSRINTLYMIAKAGSGHIGTSFSSMDIFSWLHLNVLKSDDIFFSSKGHDAPGLYSVLIGLGKIDYDYIHKLRRLNGLPGHPDVSVIPCMETNTGSLGMGVSKAKGMVVANRLNGKNIRVYVLTGDGELQEGQFWESLPGAVNGNFEEITVIVDYNKIQSDTWVCNVSDLGDIEAKLTSYGWHVQRCNGNNIEDLSKVIEATNKVKKKPKIIIADTIKGYGVSFMEASAMENNQEFYKFHSGAPSSKDYERASVELIDNVNRLLDRANLKPLRIVKTHREKVNLQQNNIQKLIPEYEKSLNDLGGKHKDIVVLDADLMIDCGLLSFSKNYPERFIECGIAEQDMLSQAGALALKGKLPISHSFSCFLATRANEQFYNNASERTKCIYVGSLAGLLPSGPGHSHQMVHDISILGGIPGLILLEPSCEEEVRMILKYAVEDSIQSTYIRLVSIPYEVPYILPIDYTLEKGKGVALTKGKDAIVFAYGMVMLSELYKASKILQDKYEFGLKVVNLPWLNYIDKDWLADEIGVIKNIFTVDNHLIKGGQGQYISNSIIDSNLNTCNIKIVNLGLKDIPLCGMNDEVLKHYRLDSNSLVNIILNQ